MTSKQPTTPQISWGAVFGGAAVAAIGTVIASLLLVSAVSSFTDVGAALIRIAIAILLFAAIGGYTAARVAGYRHVAHGTISALTGAGVLLLLGLVTGGSIDGRGLVGTAAIFAVAGSAGGFVARAQSSGTAARSAGAPRSGTARVRPPPPPGRPAPKNRPDTCLTRGRVIDMGWTMPHDMAEYVDNNLDGSHAQQITLDFSKSRPIYPVTQNALITLIMRSLADQRADQICLHKAPSYMADELLKQATEQGWQLGSLRRGGGACITVSGPKPMAPASAVGAVVENCANCREPLTGKRKFCAQCGHPAG